MTIVGEMNGLIGRSPGTAGMVLRIPVNSLAMSASPHPE
jgi:hypothetical protein